MRKNHWEIRSHKRRLSLNKDCVMNIKGFNLTFHIVGSEGGGGGNSNGLI